jgi:uncharacterized cupredoxin-like copper-binding protein
MKRTILISLLLLAALFVAACGGGDSTPAPAAGSAQDVLNQANVGMHDIYYGEENNNVEKPPVWTVGAGQDITLNMDNKGALEHSWVVLKAGTKDIPMPFTDANKDLEYFSSGVLKPATQKTDTFKAPTEPGEYTVICTVPGHYPVMQGRLVVK